MADTLSNDPVRQANGYVLNVSEARRPVLLDAKRSGDRVAQSVPDFSQSRSHPLVCFVGFQDGFVTHLALGRRGHYSATGERRLNLEELTKLAAPVAHAAILEKVSKRFQPHVAQRFNNGGLLPPGSFGAVIDALRNLVPESNQLLERFSARRRAEIAGLGSDVRRALGYQKEAVATALEFADIDKRKLQEWRPRFETGAVPSFLDGLPQARLREDQMLINDLQKFPGFDLVRTTQHASAVFTNDRVQLTVVMANRTPLEKQTGADLIYRNETYGSFVIVQYKAMEDEFGTARFRLPNEQLAAEIKRMEEVWETIRHAGPDSRLDGFRLKDNPFFLKLCPRIVFDPDDGSLIRGMYLPLEHWRRLEVDDSIKGTFNGLGITFDNAGRHFNNTSFAEMVANGWIGTTSSQTAILDPVIRQSLESGRAVTIAVKRDLTPEEQQERLRQREEETEEAFDEDEA
jgi:hypothetical protein